MVSLTAALFSSPNTISNHANNLALAQASLSSGNAITQASQDVADLAVGTALNTQVTSLRSALGNASQATSLLQVANGGLDQQLNILQQQKAIAVQASSGAIDDTTRSVLNQQFQGLSDELGQIASATNFNGVSLLDGSNPSTTFTLGTTSADSVNVPLPNTTTNTLFSGQTPGISTQSQAAAAADAIDQAISVVSSAQASVGASQSQVNASSDVLSTSIQSQQAASSSLLDTDVAAESTTAAAANILLQASIAMHAHGKGLASNLLTLLQ